MQRIPLTEEELEVARLNGHSTEPRIVGFCDDCENESDDLHPWKYDANVYLCEDCYAERMKEETR